MHCGCHRIVLGVVAAGCLTLGGTTVETRQSTSLRVGAIVAPSCRFEVWSQVDQGSSAVRVRCGSGSLRALRVSSTHSNHSRAVTRESVASHATAEAVFVVPSARDTIGAEILVSLNF